VANLKSIASSQRKLIIFIFLQVALCVAMVIFRQMNAPQILLLCVDVALTGTMIGGAVYTFMLAVKIHRTAAGVLIGLLSLVPCLALPFMLAINSSTTRLLRDNGHHVGLLGADMSEF
jgi:hypothetical protein